MPKKNPSSLMVGEKYLDFYRRQRGLSKLIPNDPRERRDVQPRISSEDLDGLAITREGKLGPAPMEGIERPADNATHAELLAMVQRLWDALHERGDIA